MTTNTNTSTLPKTLICDEDEKARESLKLILSDHFPLIITEDGEQCLDILKNSNDIGLLLLDMKMPQTSGLNILEQIKNDYPGLNVIIITDHKSVENATEAVRLGASGYIVKPFKSEEILATVRKNLSL